MLPPPRLSRLIRLRGFSIYRFIKLMNKTAYKLLAVVLGWLSFGSTNAATVECIDNQSSVGIRLVGSIGVGDYQQVESCWKTLTQPTREQKAQLAELNKNEPGRYELVEKSLGPFVLSSKGGLVSEAMKIGRFVRSKKIWVAVPDWGECFSSCVYILAAGSVRLAWGDIGIHRPYFLSPPNQSFDISLKNMLSQSKEYFREMNVPDFLAEDMFSIPPDDIKILGDALLTRYRLNQNDMAYEEENAIRNAAAYGLSRQEYMTRLKLSKKYMNECVKKFHGNASTSDVVACGDISYKRAGLILKK